MLVTTKEMFKKSMEEGFAIGAFNVNNKSQNPRLECMPCKIFAMVFENFIEYGVKRND